MFILIMILAFKLKEIFWKSIILLQAGLKHYKEKELMLWS